MSATDGSGYVWDLENTVDRRLILDSLSVHREFAMHTMSQLISWYTFFITANIVTGGWFVLALLDDKKNIPINIFIYVSIVFIIANIIAIVICVLVKVSMHNHVKNMVELIQLTGRDIGSNNTEIFTAVPLRLYTAVPLGMVVTFVLLTALWVRIPIHASSLLQ